MTPAPRRTGPTRHMALRFGLIYRGPEAEPRSQGLTATSLSYFPQAPPYPPHTLLPQSQVQARHTMQVQHRAQTLSAKKCELKTNASLRAAQDHSTDHTQAQHRQPCVPGTSEKLDGAHTPHAARYRCARPVSHADPGTSAQPRFNSNTATQDMVQGCGVAGGERVSSSASAVHALRKPVSQ